MRRAPQHWVAAALTGLALLPLGLRSADLLELRERREGGAIAVEAVNKDPYAPRWAWIQMQGAQNARPDVPLPQGFVLAPRQQRTLFTVRPQDPSQGFRYGLQQRSGEGDPTREPDAKHVYLLPYAHASKQNLSQGYFGSATHQGLHALDFDLPEGSPVHAARAGVVIAIKQDSSEGGSSRLYADEGNYVQVLHEDATWALYAHLQRQGALVRVGDRVQAGQRIGLSGSTGLASGPHLHFAVYRADWNGPRTVPTIFKTGLSEAASLEEGRTYYAYHPGGAAFKPELGEALNEAALRGVTRSAQGGKVRLREQKVDRRVLVWAVNPTGGPITMDADVTDAHGTRASTVLPLKLEVPAYTEVYAFHLDLVGLQSAYRLSARWRPIPKGTGKP